MFQFEEARDAEDAIRGRDGYDFDGNRLRVGHTHKAKIYVGCLYFFLNATLNISYSTLFE